MIIRGFRFGMLLQLAVGPMCLLVFNTSMNYGFVISLSLVSAITLIDLLYITLSGLGVGAILDKDKIKLAIKIFGSLVLLLFGFHMILGVFDLSVLPNIQLFSRGYDKSLFVQGLLLTASNPLTIIFWSGVFSSQVIENKYNKRQLCLFGLGCVLSTILFLTFVAVLGTTLRAFLSENIMKTLNILVGSVIIFFGLKLLLKRNTVGRDHSAIA